MKQAVVLVLFGALCVATASIAGVGKCRTDVEGLKGFSLEEFASKNNGLSYYKQIPDVEQFKKYTKIYSITVATEEKGKYRTTTFKQEGANAPEEKIVDQYRVDKGDGHLSGDSVSGNRHFEIYYLVDKPSVTMFYVCSADGADDHTDYVYVGVPKEDGTLSDADLAKVKEVRDKYNFKGSYRNV